MSSTRQKLNISEINIIPCRPRNGLVAFTSFVLNNEIYIGNVAIYQLLSVEDGYRLVYPDKMLPNGKKINCVFPINKVVGESIKKAVVERYENVIEKLMRGKIG